MKETKPEIIPEEVIRQFGELSRMAMDMDPSLASKPIKYKVGWKVMVNGLGPDLLEIKRAAPGVYLVLKDNNYHLCEEGNIIRPN